MNDGDVYVTMDLRGLDDNKSRFVCPSDRQLALRAKLQTGWSSVKPGGPLDANERNAIIAVVKRNEQLETAERQRVGRLVERVEKIKLRAAECGPRFCRMCGQSFGLLGPSKFICDDCKKPVCSKCATELHSKVNSKDAWLCKICSETRELWMKTGAWFYKTMPQFEVPPPRANNSSNGSGSTAGHSHLHLLAPMSVAAAPKPAKLRIQCVDTSSEEDDDVDDDGTDGTSSTASERYFMRERPSSFLRKHPLFNRKAAADVATHQSPGRTKSSGAAAYTAAERPKHPLIVHQQQQQQQQQHQQTLHQSHAATTTTTMTHTSHNNASSSSSSASPYIVEWETVSIASRQNASCNGSLSRRGSVSSSMSMSETSSANSSNAEGLNHGMGSGIFNGAVVVSGPNCKEPSLGWLELVLRYSEADHTLDCAVVRARDLPAMDTAGLADPFCKVNIITEYGTVKQAKWFRTRTVHKTINPEFNESVRFMGVEPDELAHAMLYVVVLDDDRYGHDFLGTAKVALGPSYHNEVFRMSIPLETEDQHSVEAAVSGPWSNGQILVAMCYNTRRRALMVQVKRCINLLAKDKNGQSDPFVKLQIKPDAHRNKKMKTSIKWRTLNPIFDEEFVFETRPNELDKQSVLLAVWDKDLGKSNDFLGALTLGAHSKGGRLKQWKDCIRIPDQYHEQWHYLSNDQNAH